MDQNPTNYDGGNEPIQRPAPRLNRKARRARAKRLGTLHPSGWKPRPPPPIRVVPLD